MWGQWSNIDEAAAREFKHFLRDLVAQGGAAIAARISGFSVEDGVTLLLQTHALAIGAGQMAAPPPTIARVLDANPSLQIMRIDFQSFLAGTLEDLVRGRLAAP